ncbi:unnamed protein product [Trichogramma brassicae]|uniref:Uncharacterized protein n=1 Tax=Trichogramma brassicae TaxID=86971 RepID=A0A6H5HUF7_9HYME|nr:unnamed protein product [Trichogramma brassicae]
MDGPRPGGTAFVITVASAPERDRYVNADHCGELSGAFVDRVERASYTIKHIEAHSLVYSRFRSFRNQTILGQMQTATTFSIRRLQTLKRSRFINHRATVRSPRARSEIASGKRCWVLPWLARRRAASIMRRSRIRARDATILKLELSEVVEPNAYLLHTLHTDVHIHTHTNTTKDAAFWIRLSKASRCAPLTELSRADTQGDKAQQQQQQPRLRAIGSTRFLKDPAAVAAAAEYKRRSQNEVIQALHRIPRAPDA